MVLTTRKPQLTYAALGRADADMLKAICDFSGYKSKYGKKEIMHQMMQFGYDSFGPEVLGDKNVMQVCERLCSGYLPSISHAAHYSQQLLQKIVRRCHECRASAIILVLGDMKLNCRPIQPICAVQFSDEMAMEDPWVGQVTLILSPSLLSRAIIVQSNHC